MSITSILTEHGIRLVSDGCGEGGKVSDRAYPRAEANDIVRKLRIAGAVADGAPDADDRALMWIYVTVPPRTEVRP